MAELLVARGWPQSNSLATTLRDALSNDFCVIAQPVVHDRPLDLIVVGPQGLFILLTKQWQGHIFPAKRGRWWGLAPSGQRAWYTDPRLEMRSARKALQAFLSDEFPTLHPAIHSLLVLTHPSAALDASHVSELQVVTRESVSEVIAATPSAAGVPPLDPGTSRTLAEALRDRQLTTNQRAAAPFVFRSGGLLDSGHKVWTLRELVDHIDRHPEDGIFHLRNGTLAAWLSEQGAGHLVEVLQEVVRGRDTDPRVVVEKLLLATGLVRRPRLIVRPRQLYLGPVLSGEVGVAHLRVRKGRGRGFLFGTVRTSDPWLRVESTAFTGQLDAAVTAETESLPISQKPWRAQILIDSSASEEPVQVQVRVVAIPSPLNRWLLRPAVGSLAAGLLGAGVGAALGLSGLSFPAWPAHASPLALPLFWAIVVGLVWAFFGGLRGASQPESWPVTYAFGRWFLRTVLWGAVFALLGALAHWSWTVLGPDLSSPIAAPSTATSVLLALALAIVPAVVGEVRSARNPKAATGQPTGRFARRPLLLAAAGLLLALAVVLGAPLLAHGLQHADVSGAAHSVQQWAGGQWTRLQATLSGWVDRLNLRYYDRRAPLATPVPTFTPVPQPSKAPARGLP